MISLWLLLGGLALLLFQYIYRKSWDKGLTFQLRFEKDHAYCLEEATLVETLENRRSCLSPLWMRLSGSRRVYASWMRKILR